MFVSICGGGRYGRRYGRGRIRCVGPGSVGVGGRLDRGERIGFVVGRGIRRDDDLG